MTGTLDWDRYRLVVFDVDGTLYDQSKLRRLMLRSLLVDAARTRSLETIRILRTFRKFREELAGANDSIISSQYALPARRLGVSPVEVSARVEMWMDRRPLDHIAACRYPHVDEVFAGLRQRGVTIGIFSDYPAASKLAAMGLRSDIVVSATDPQIDRLKPDPKGLLTILELSGVPADRALMIGDRVERDGLAAQRAGVDVLLRGPQNSHGHSFRAYSDRIFSPLRDSACA